MRAPRRKDAKAIRSQKKRSRPLDELLLEEPDVVAFNSYLKLHGKAEIAVEDVFGQLTCPVNLPAMSLHMDHMMFANLLLTLIIQHLCLYKWNAHLVNWDGFLMLAFLLVHRSVSPYLMTLFSSSRHMALLVLAFEIAGLSAAGSLYCAHGDHPNTSLVSISIVPVWLSYWVFIFYPRVTFEGPPSRWLWYELRESLWHSLEGPYYATIVPLLVIENPYMIYSTRSCCVIIVVALVCSVILRCQRLLSLYFLELLLQARRIRAVKRKMKPGLDPGTSSNRLISPSNTFSDPHHQAVEDSSPSLPSFLEGVTPSLIDFFSLAFSDPFGLHLRLLHLSAAVCFGLFVLTLLSEWWAGYLALLAASYGITFVLLRERQFFV